MNKITEEVISTKQCSLFIHVCNFVKFVFIEPANCEVCKVLLLIHKEPNLWYENYSKYNYLHMRII